ncbi:hypothetical protein B0H11DRAFT_1922379 [Mycena galericulata]|nr:hypothetical protein B0H11DRAFT_1922379 [Mycena galericulata]
MVLPECGDCSAAEDISHAACTNKAATGRTFSVSAKKVGRGPIVEASAYTLRSSICVVSSLPGPPAARSAEATGYIPPPIRPVRIIRVKAAVIIEGYTGPPSTLSFLARGEGGMHEGCLPGVQAARASRSVERTRKIGLSWPQAGGFDGEGLYSLQSRHGHRERRCFRHSWRARFYPAECIGKGWHLVLQHDVEVVFVKLPTFLSSVGLACRFDKVQIDRVGLPLVLLTAFLRVSSSLSLPGPNHAELRELLAIPSVNICALVSLELVEIKFGSTESDHLSYQPVAFRSPSRPPLASRKSAGFGSPDDVALSIWEVSLLSRAVFSPGVQSACGLSLPGPNHAEFLELLATSSVNIRGLVSLSLSTLSSSDRPSRTTSRAPDGVLCGRRLVGRLWLARRRRLVDPGGLRSVSCGLLARVSSSLPFTWSASFGIAGLRPEGVYVPPARCESQPGYLCVTAPCTGAPLGTTPAFGTYVRQLQADLLDQTEKEKVEEELCA